MHSLVYGWKYLRGRERERKREGERESERERERGGRKKREKWRESEKEGRRSRPAKGGRPTEKADRPWGNCGTSHRGERKRELSLPHLQYCYQTTINVEVKCYSSELLLVIWLPQPIYCYLQDQLFLSHYFSLYFCITHMKFEHILRFLTFRDFQISHQIFPSYCRS